MMAVNGLVLRPKPGGVTGRTVDEDGLVETQHVTVVEGDGGSMAFGGVTM